MKTKDEIKEGNHSIGYVSSSFESKFGDKEFESVKALPSYQTLTRSMKDVEIESELKPGFCTLGDVLAVIQSDNPVFKDGNWNIFYFDTCVVFVFCYGSCWYVFARDRDDDVWASGRRVFSPATGNSASVVSSAPSLGSFDLGKTLRDMLPEFIDAEFPKGHESRGEAMAYTALFVAWVGKQLKK